MDGLVGYWTIFGKFERYWKNVGRIWRDWKRNFGKFEGDLKNFG